MTREEAISVLKETIDTNVDKSFKEWREWDKEKHLPAVNMAIEALTYQNLSKPINTCEVDLISRKDAMGAVQDHFSAGGFKGYYDGQKMMDRITALPSAEAVQGVGRYEKAMEILREMPRRLSGIIEKQIKRSKDERTG